MVKSRGGIMVEKDEYSKGYERGQIDAWVMKQDAVGCRGCAFEDANSWEMPCAACSRNCKDYWRAKKV